MSMVDFERSMYEHNKQFVQMLKEYDYFITAKEAIELLKKTIDILNEFDIKYHESRDRIINLINKKYNYDAMNIIKLEKLDNKKLYKYNNIQYVIGADEFNMNVASGGTAAFSVNPICSGTSTQVSLTGQTTGANISYQWQARQGNYPPENGLDSKAVFSGSRSNWKARRNPRSMARSPRPERRRWSCAATPTKPRPQRASASPMTCPARTTPACGARPTCGRRTNPGQN